MKAFLLALALTIAAAASAQTPTPSPRLVFDVASIHPSQPGQNNGGIKPIPGGHGYTARNIPVRLMVALMYKIPVRQIEGGSDWVNDQPFDVEARVDGTYSTDDLHIMFQNLLVDRFGLKFHTDTREGNVYALTVDPSGLKMKPNTTPEDFEIPMQGAPAKMAGKRVSMKYLCWFLGQVLQNDERPCVDQTGLTGNYDFTLSFTLPRPPGAPEDGAAPNDLPSIFDAVKQQLGLRLTAQKGPVEHIVIDHIDKPSDN